MTQITGKAKKFDGTAIDYVQAFRWIDGQCVDVVTTDELGNWAVGVYGLVDLGFTYVADGCEPLTHGPYSFDEPYDLNWSNVSLLTHLDGNASDVTGNFDFEAIGNVSYVEGMFNKAIKLDPASSSERSGLLDKITGNPALTLGEDDFTIEFFINPAANYTQSNQGLLSATVFSQSVFAAWRVGLLDLHPSFYVYEGSGTYLIEADTPLVADTWSHVAVSRVGGVVSMYINGVVVGSAPDSYNYSAYKVKLSVGFQDSGSADYPYKGMLDEIRITKGIARYTADFTPPTRPHDHGSIS